MEGELRVVATAGHVDHGKSSLIVRLTGIDPDRWAEEKRRGLTIDLGYAWCTLPSGREIGFVDVPGHERFIDNMLAGVGPVRLVMFVVAADERWKAQSEEHLAILDVLGVAGGVVALTKRDLVDDEALAFARDEVRERLKGTALAGVPIVPVSSATGEGLDQLAAELDAMLDAAPPPEPARARLFVDRVFTIKGSGTVATGTLVGGCMEVGDEVELYPKGARARIRALQTHKRDENRACHVSRVAANLVGADGDELTRGDVLGATGSWQPTRLFEASFRPVRSLGHTVTSRGAFKIYAGAAEADARLRILGATKIEPGAEALVRVRLSRPLVLDVFDRFVVREAGRRETLGGGVVLDISPPPRPGVDAHLRLSARARATREDLPRLLATERGAVRTDEAEVLTGSRSSDPGPLAGWLVRDDVREAVERAVAGALGRFHEAHPLAEGASLALARDEAAAALRFAGAPGNRDLANILIQSLVDSGEVARSATTIRLASHSVAVDAASDELRRLVAAVGGASERTPPTTVELLAAGFSREVIDAAARGGMIVRVGAELVFTSAFVERAEHAVREAGASGITVSAFREALGTSRKYAVPLLEWFDQHGITRRAGDLRFPRE